MEKMRVLIVAKTRRGGGACIGAIAADGRSVRLDAANKGTDEHANRDYEIGDVWEIDVAPAEPPAAPHVETVVVYGRRLQRQRVDPIPIIERFMPPRPGGIDVLFDGLLQHTSTGALYIARESGVPGCSTMFWRPDQPLRLDTDAKRLRYRYPTPDGGRTLTFVGLQESVPELPAGTLLRVSLAHWWRPPEDASQEERCYAQLSGWWLPPAAEDAPAPAGKAAAQPDALPGLSSSPAPSQSSGPRWGEAAAGQPAAPAADEPDLAPAYRVLKDVFGFDSFRSLQAEIIGSVLAGRDTLAILPTGSGKSLCYQLPALLRPGLTVVVSPLIALMQDQVDALRLLGIPSVFLNSTLDYATYLQNVDYLKRGAVKLLYLAPETLVRPETLALLDQCRVDCLTIDEAHCISQWGHDFRPEYRQLAGVRRRFDDAVCLALTATASPRVQRDIGQILGMADNEDAAIFVASFDRENLFFSAQPRSAGLQQLLAFLAGRRQDSGIVYCSTRKLVDDVTADLQQAGYSALPYHAGMDDAARRSNQRAFVRDEAAIMVATVAFGMGINKPNVRFVVHYNLPPSLEHYYQEVGRAGRDGLPAECLLLYATADVQQQRRAIDEGAEAERAGRAARLQAMLRYAQATDCRRRQLLTYFGEDWPAEPCGGCDVCRQGADDRPRVDVTAAAVRFLTAVQQTRQRFGIDYTVRVLRGSQVQKVLQNRHNLLPVYGQGQDLSEKQWKNLAQQLIQQGLLVQEMEHATLQITPQGAAVLQGKNQVWIAAEPEPAAAAAEPARAFDVGLYESLRQLRRRLAEEANVPPYLVFADRTLMEMATYFPQSETALLAINGVGQLKLERYGEIFLSAIRSYCAEHGLAELPKPALAPAVERVPSQRSKRRYEEVGEVFAAGSSIADLMDMYHVTKGTIVEHLSEYQRRGHPVDVERLQAGCALTAEQQAAVLAAFSELGPERLAPVYERFVGEFNYVELRLLRAVWLAQQAQA